MKLHAAPCIQIFVRGVPPYGATNNTSRSEKAFRGLIRSVWQLCLPPDTPQTIHTPIHMHICIHIYIYVYKQLSKSTNTYVHICTHICAYVYTYVYIYIYICTSPPLIHFLCDATMLAILEVPTKKNRLLVVPGSTARPARTRSSPGQCCPHDQRADRSPCFRDSSDPSVPMKQGLLHPILGCWGL